ncbi:MAG TPA: DUF6675 family protein [Xanthobacteraceae bacterium]|jgi:hypothetical protein
MSRVSRQRRAATLALVGVAICLWATPAPAVLPVACHPPAWPGVAPAGYTPEVLIGPASDFVGDPSAPACFEWDSRRFPQVAAIRGLIDASNANSLIERLGAVSHFTGMRYWSVTDHRLEVLITAAFAIRPARLTEPRPDYSLQEMRAGQELEFSEHDNRLPEAVIYRMRILERDEHHFVVDISNVTPVKRLLFTLFSPGDIRTVFFVSEARPRVWTCFALSGLHTSSLASLVENPKSHLNRLIALYGYLAQSDLATLPWGK